MAGMCGISLCSIEGIPDHCVKTSPKLLKHGRWNVGSDGLYTTLPAMLQELEYSGANDLRQELMI